MYPDVYQLADRLLMPDTGKAKATKISRKATDGISIKHVTLEPDKIYWLGPGEIADFLVGVSPTGIRGEQRDPTADAQGRRKVREIADAITAGKVLPDVLVALDDSESTQLQFVPDGGHRCCAAFLARMPIRVATRNLTPDQRRQLFIDQSKARKIKTQQFVVDGDGPIDLYVQDALTRTDHPWSDLVAHQARSGRMSPAQMATLAGMYGCDQIRGTYLHLDQSRFDTDAATELASLLRCFGSHASNPLAFRDKSRRASVLAAIHSVRRSDQRVKDAKRWTDHMPAFRFAEHQHVRESTALCDCLLGHWNKRLSLERKVQR